MRQSSMNQSKYGHAKTGIKDGARKKAQAVEKAPSGLGVKGEKKVESIGGWNSFQTDLNAYKLSETELVEEVDRDQEEG